MKPEPQHLAEQLHLQDTLNSLVTPDWRGAKHPWSRAIMVEAVEMLEHHGWKWWKSQEPDVAQIKLELVDIWHFILSDTMTKTPFAEARILNRLDHPETTVYVGYAPTDLELLDTVQLMEAFISLAAGGIVSITAFDMLRDEMRLSWAELHRLYIAKNVLNIFRQKHGYKDGTYVKTWYGKEDNEVLQGLLDARPNATVDQLFTKLTQIYSSLQKETA